MILSRESMQSEKSREPRLDPRSPSYSGWVVDEKETEKLILQKGRSKPEGNGMVEGHFRFLDLILIACPKMLQMLFLKLF